MRELARVLDDVLVGFEQPGEHGGDLLRAVRRPRDPGDLRDVARVAHRDGAQRLHPLGDEVHELLLLLRVLVQEQVELIERGAAHQPVALLVEVVQDARVGEDLVQS